MSDLARVNYDYKPNGVDHELQNLITDLLHRRIMEDGRITLAELGYLHMNTLMLNQATQCVELKIFFDSRFVCRKIKDPKVGKEVIRIVDEMNIFKNYLFVGDVQESITIEKILGPKTEVVEDEMGRASIKFKKGNKQVETIAAVLNCSFPIAMAAAHDVNLYGQDFRVHIEPVAKGSDHIANSIVISASNKIIPIAVHVSYVARTEVTSENRYDPQLAVLYLDELIEKLSHAEEVRVKTAEKVQKKGKKAKKDAKRNAKGFSNFA